MKRQRTLFDRNAQIACAAIIAANPVRYPGIMQEWARIVIAKQQAAGTSI